MTAYLLLRYIQIYSFHKCKNNEPNLPEKHTKDKKLSKLQAL